MNKTETKDQYFSEREVSFNYNLSRSNLAHRRMKGFPPAYLKIGKLVRYTMSDVEEWLTSKKIEPIKGAV